MSPLCTFCNASEEKVSHLFFFCNIVHGFLRETLHWLQNFSIFNNLEPKTILFGIHEEPAASKSNVMLLWIKSYIWIIRTKKENVSLTTFKAVLRNRLQELKEMYEFLNKEYSFDKWNTLNNNLTQDG